MGRSHANQDRVQRLGFTPQAGFLQVFRSRSVDTFRFAGSSKYLFGMQVNFPPHPKCGYFKVRSVSQLLART